MCRENSMNQINAAIENLLNALSSAALLDAQSQALAFIQAAFEAEELSQIEKQTLEKKYVVFTETNLLRNQHESAPMPG